MKARKTPKEPVVGKTPEPSARTPEPPEACRLDEQQHPVCGCARPVLLEPEKKK